MKALISNIQRYSIHDGPGIRTTVFFMGCAMRCRWCHNPECMTAAVCLQHTPQTCIGCGSCTKACSAGALRLTAEGLQYDERLCRHCFSCTAACPSGALFQNGRFYTPGELLEQLLEDRSFYENSGGGVTFSGGEAVLQSAFLSEVLQRCKEENIHCTVDTAGHTDWGHFEQIRNLADLYLYDIKSMNREKHLAFTGVGNETILSNLKQLDLHQAKLIIRIPMIPTFNDTYEDMVQIADFLDTLHQRPQVELIGYHKLAEGKYRGLWRSAFMFPELTPETSEMLAGIFADRGYPVKLHRHT